VAKVLGSDLFPLLRDLHFNECALHSDVHRLQTSAFPREQASGAARDLVGQIERSGIQISSVGSVCQSEFTEWAHGGGATLVLSCRNILNRSMKPVKAVASDGGYDILWDRHVIACQ